MPREAVLAALYNKAQVQGMGIFHSEPGPMTPEAAGLLLKAGVRYFDYLKGRVMKVDMYDLDLRLYVRDNGQWAVDAAVLDALDMLTRPGAK